jgi:nitrite reductase (NADH) small subunit
MNASEGHADAAPRAEAHDFQRAGSLSSLHDNGAFAAIVAGRCVAVFKVGGSVVATQGRCPHARGPIHEGEIVGEMLTCPWHGYTFSLRTGSCDDDPSLSLERYEVRVAGDDILVRV